MEIRLFILEFAMVISGLFFAINGHEDAPIICHLVLIGLIIKEGVTVYIGK